MALYVPEKKPLVLNSRSASRSCVSLRAVHASPSSITIFPKRIPRAYMFGIVITYSVEIVRVIGAWRVCAYCLRTAVLWTTHQRYAVLALHGRRDGIAEELGFGPELADDAEFVRRRDVEKGGYGWVVRYCRENKGTGEISWKNSFIGCGGAGFIPCSEMKNPCVSFG